MFPLGTKPWDILGDQVDSCVSRQGKSLRYSSIVWHMLTVTGKEGGGELEAGVLRHMTNRLMEQASYQQQRSPVRTFGADHEEGEGRVLEHRAVNA